MSLKGIWAEGRPALNGWLGVPSFFSAEVMAHQGWDTLTIDMQHGLIDYGDAAPMLAAIGTTRTVPMVRVPWLDPGIVMKALDAGALGVICPMVNSRADAEILASCLRYAPRGRRSFGPIRAVFAHGGDYTARADDLVVGLAMIETKEALEAVDSIVSVPELDGVYIGPNDLALSLGVPARFDPVDATMTKAIDHILARAKAAGKRAGIHCGSAEYAQMMTAKGFDLVTVGSDARFIAEGAAKVVSEFRGAEQGAKSAY